MNNVKVLIPRGYYELSEKDGPLFFLAGPIRGGNDWQKKACEILSVLLPTCVVAIPYYPTEKEYFPLAHSTQHGVLGKFARQLDWERYYIEEAAKHGCLIFWLPEESKVNPRTSEEGPFATDTRGEIGRWSIEQKYNQTYRIIIGAEDKFPGRDVLERNWNLDQAKEINFPRTLEETLKLAVAKIRDIN